MTAGLAVCVVAEEAWVVGVAWDVAVVSRVVVQGLRLDEPGVREGHQGVVLLGIVVAEVP